MIEHLDGYDLYNTVRLQLAADSTRIIVVEGEEDYDLLFEFFDTLTVYLLPGYGKQISLAAAQLSETDVDDVRFLVDADFDRLTGAVDTYASKVIATDHYDLVVDIAELNQEILKRIARLNSQGENPAAPQDQIGLAKKASVYLGGVRLASSLQGWSLNLKGFPIHLCLPTSVDGDVDTSRIVSLVLDRTVVCAVTAEVVIAEVELQLSTIGRVESVVNGHDLLNSLTHVGRTFAGAKAKTDYTMQFALAVGDTELMKVPALKSLHDWTIAA